jgi:hypothetical protein
MTSLTDIYRDNQDREYQVKLASVTDAYSDDQDRLTLLDTAVDLIKQAQESGTLSAEMHPSDVLTLAVQLVEDEFAGEEQEKVASEAYETDESNTEDFYEGEELSKEAAEQVIAMGEAVGQILAQRGITAEDLEKIASEEEAEALGRYCAQIYAELAEADTEEA